MSYIKYIVSLIIIVCFIGLFTCLSYAGIGAQPDFQEFVGMPFGSIKKVLLEELQANPGPLTSFRGMAQRAGNLDQI